jgi:uncharacterized membrane protein YgcG
MKRLLLGLSAVILLSIVNIGFAHASVNDFIIKDFQADYYLDKDSEGRSTLKTVELITADFPSIDQNHGIERAIPTSYDNHSVNLAIQSVTDINGVTLPYKTIDQNGNLVLRIGNADTYVHGLNTYKITYTQRDVTKYFSDTNSDEFYWDVNGTDWAQPINKVTARLHVGSSILASLNGKQACYYGAADSTTQCIITLSDGIYTAEASTLNAGENLTISVGFNPNTFSQYKMSAVESMIAMFIAIYFILAIISFFAIIALVIILFILKSTKGKGDPGKGIIIAEYLPPKKVDVALSSVIIKKERAWAAATYVDFAVRHNIKIIEVNGENHKKATYTLEFVSAKGLDDTENAVMSALFGDNPQAGAKYNLEPNKPDYIIFSKLTEIYKQSKLLAQTDGYYEVNKKLRKTMIIIVVVIGVLSIFTLFIGIIGLAIGIMIIMATKPFSQKGRELLDYLNGLKLYIEIAEEDRIKVLQSPQGAIKTPIDTNDSAKVVRLYERVLPYAVLFGNEKEWAKVLGNFYEQQNMTPDWYVGNNAFNAVMFGAALSGFSSNATSNSYSSPVSSSSGGSGGGGFSGGGGGGGGGGGW